MTVKLRVSLGARWVGSMVGDDIDFNNPLTPPPPPVPVPPDVLVGVDAVVLFSLASWVLKARSMSIWPLITSYFTYSRRKGGGGGGLSGLMGLVDKGK